MKPTQNAYNATEKRREPKPPPILGTKLGLHLRWTGRNAGIALSRHDLRDAALIYAIHGSSFVLKHAALGDEPLKASRHLRRKARRSLSSDHCVVSIQWLVQRTAHGFLPGKHPVSRSHSTQNIPKTPAAARPEEDA